MASIHSLLLIAATTMCKQVLFQAAVDTARKLREAARNVG